MTAQSTVFSEKNRLGDLIIAEFHEAYNRVSALVTGAAGVAVDLLDCTGYPVKSNGSGGYQLALAGDEASIIGLLLDRRELIVAASPAVSARPVDIIVRGPAVYNPGLLPVNDANPTPGTFNQATLQSTLKSLNLIPITESGIEYTQTT